MIAVEAVSGADLEEGADGGEDGRLRSGGPGDAYAAAASELEDAVSAQLPVGGEDGVAVDVERLTQLGRGGNGSPTERSPLAMPRRMAVTICSRRGSGAV